jgi:hypothetical protein
MITTRSCSQRPHPPELCRRLAPAFSAVTALLMSAALVCPVAAEQPASCRGTTAESSPTSLVMS